MNEGMRWEQLQLSLSKQVPMRTIEPTFVNVHHILTRSQDLTSRAIETLTAQRQVAEVIRASLSALDIELDAFYGAVPGTWRLLALCVVIISLARLVVAFVENEYRRRWFVYGLSVYLIATRLFGVFGLPPSLFRLYIFSTILVGILICLWRSAAGARRGDAPLCTRVLKLGALICLLISDSRPDASGPVAGGIGEKKIWQLKAQSMRP